MRRCCLSGSSSRRSRFARDLEAADRDVRARDALEDALVDEALQQLALAAAQVEHAARLGLAERGDHRGEPRLVEEHPRLDGVLGAAFASSVSSGLALVVGHEARERHPEERPAVLEVAERDRLALGVLREPALALGEEVVDLRVAHPVVLLVVQHGHEHVQVREQLPQPARPRRARRGGYGLCAPLREHLVEREALGRDLVAERLEEPPEQRLPAAARQGLDRGGERDRASASSGPVRGACRPSPSRRPARSRRERNDEAT